MHATIVSLFSTVPVDDAQVVQVLKSQYDLCWVELGTTFIKTSHLYTHKLSWEHHRLSSECIEIVKTHAQDVSMMLTTKFVIYMEYTIHEYMTTFKAKYFSWSIN